MRSHNFANPEPPIVEACESGVSRPTANTLKRILNDPGLKPRSPPRQSNSDAIPSSPPVTPYSSRPEQRISRGKHRETPFPFPTGRKSRIISQKMTEIFRKNLVLNLSLLSEGDPRTGQAKS